MSSKARILIVVVAILAIALNDIFYTVDETEQALVVQFGKPVAVKMDPGLYCKYPFIQKALFFNKRLLDYGASPAEVLTTDKKALLVDNYAKWRIVDPLEFYRTVRNVSEALRRLDDIINAEIRVNFGRYEMHEIITTLRVEVLSAVTTRANKAALEYGITILDVRTKRIDLPVENEQSVLERMRAERAKMARKSRAEGEEEALRVRAGAEKQRTMILAAAYREAQGIMGEGDGESTRIYANAFRQDSDFFSFLRSLEAYTDSMKDGSTIILSPSHPFLRHFISSSLQFDKDSPESIPGK